MRRFPIYIGKVTSTILSSTNLFFDLHLELNTSNLMSTPSSNYLDVIVFNVLENRPCLYLLGYAKEDKIYCSGIPTTFKNINVEYVIIQDQFNNNEIPRLKEDFCKSFSELNTEDESIIKLYTYSFNTHI